MSYNYLRHSRRPSQRAAPPAEEGSIDALLDLTSLTSHTLFRTQILTNTHPTPLTIPSQAQNTTDEPLPHIDYHLLNHLIRLVTPHLDKHGKKRYDYLIEARRWYFIGHAKFQEAFRKLQDANAYGVILRAQFDEMAQKYHRTLPDKGDDDAPSSADKAKAELASQMAGIEYARRANNEALRHLLVAVREKAKARDYATSWLSSLKWKFLQTEIPPLIRYAEELYRHSMGKAAVPQVGLLPPIKYLEPYALMRAGSVGRDGADEGMPEVREGGDHVEMGEGSVGAGMPALDRTLNP